MDEPTKPWERDEQRRRAVRQPMAPDAAAVRYSQLASPTMADIEAEEDRIAERFLGGTFGQAVYHASHARSRLIARARAITNEGDR